MEEFLKAEKKEDVKERLRICQRRYDLCVLGFVAPFVDSFHA